MRSLTQRLQKSADLDPPALLAPEQGERDLIRKPQFWWEAVHGAIGYQIVIALSEEDISNPIAIDRIEASVSRAFFEPEGSLLSPGRKHYWAVRAYDSTGVGPLSEVRAFTTELVEVNVDPHGNTMLTDEDGNDLLPESTEMFPAMRETKHIEQNVLMDRYKILDELGEGGFATVYKSQDLVLNREVALKILRPELLGNDKVREDFLARFRREAQIVASLEHPHLVPVYDTGIAQLGGMEKPFIVMKLLDGEELEDIISKGPIPVPRARRLALQALEALEFVHANEITHKDLKPSNFFVCKNYKGEETLHIMDFGIAHDDKDHAGGRLTKTGTFSGTVQYLAPEYTLYQQVSPGVDVYQMGLIIIEMLIGEPVIPLDTSLPQLIGLHIKGERLRPPPEFDGTRAGEVLSKSIDLDPEVRYKDAGEFFRAFAELEDSDFPTSFEGGGGIDASAALALSYGDPEEPPPIGSAGGGNKGVIIGVLALITLLAIGGGVVAMGMGKGDPADPPDSPKNEVVTNTAPPVETKPVETAPVAEKVVETTPPAPDKKTFAIASSPAGATVVVDGEKKGVTPFELVVEGDVESFELALEHDGYESHTATVDAAEAKPLAIALTKKKRVRKNPPKKDPPKKDPPKKDPPKEDPPKKDPPKQTTPKATLPPDF